MMCLLSSKSLRRGSGIARLPVALVCVALVGCCRTVSSSPAADVAAINAVSIAWKETFNAGDPAAVTELYGENAVLSAPGRPVVRGRAAIAEYFAKSAAEFTKAGLTVTDAPMGDEGTSGDLGFQWKTYTVTDKAGAVVDAGRLLTLFQRKAGKWLIIGDTWNSNGPSR
jgi:uncharacterized protein (TIGR02246 family)